MKTKARYKSNKELIKKGYKNKTEKKACYKSNKQLIKNCCENKTEHKSQEQV